MEFVNKTQKEDYCISASEYDDDNFCKMKNVNNTGYEPSDSCELINAKIQEITGGSLEKKESDLQLRISECKGLIESLKKDLHDELRPAAAASSNSSRTPSSGCSAPSHPGHPDQPGQPSEPGETGVHDYGSLRRAASDSSAGSALLGDESILAYEEQLREYQNTLNLAQIEKKNAIRREMMAKAYKLKLLEVESRCGVELLRVRQGLQCLEPLRALAAQWAAAGDADDDDSYQLMPMYTADFANGEKCYASGADPKTDKEDTAVGDVA